ncbi:MAG: hypothetical protein JWQ54_5316 [Mucilaginibacter sp.]|nr:hypothetical protein [Mucilaginibacter sp.]
MININILPKGLCLSIHQSINNYCVKLNGEILWPQIIILNLVK